MRYENKPMKNTVYYSVYGWKDMTKCATFADDYMRLSNAEKRFDQLINSGYKQVIIRKEDVTLRNEHTEISSSGIIKVYTA